MKINGTQVVNAAKPLVLTITKKDVTLGDTKDPAACAAARCLMRQPEVEAARVHIGRTYVKIGEKWVRYNTTPALRSEIIAFDRGGRFEPGTYQLNPVSQSERARLGRRQGSAKPGARDKGSKNRTPKKTRRAPHHVTGIRASGANR